MKVLRPFLKGEQEQSEVHCLEADCAAPSIHYEPLSLKVQLNDRVKSCRSRKEMDHFS